MSMKISDMMKQKKQKPKKEPLAPELRRQRRLDTLRSMCFLGPSVAGVAVFFILPFLVVVYYSVIKSPLDPEFVFLDNFRAVLGNYAFQTAAKNTAAFSAVAVPLAVVLSLVLALILECRIPMKSWFRSFFLSPMMVPVASVVLIWQVVFHRSGVLSNFVTALGGTAVDWLNSPYCQLVIIVLFLWKNLGYNMILFMAALNNIPNELLEVADVEGASAVHKFFNIKLRYLSPTVLFVTILSIINSFKVFREIHLLVGDHPYEGLYMMQHFMNNTFARYDYQKMASAAVLMAMAMVVLIAVLFWVEDVFGKDVEG